MSDLTPYDKMGWIPPIQRTGEQQVSHDIIVGLMPRFAITGTQVSQEPKICLYDFWRHPDTVAVLGYGYPGIHQLTGSCVGAGGGNAVFTLLAIEVLRLKDPERICVPFWLLPYGRSRYYLGSRGRGEGSTGAAFAKAIKEDGILAADEGARPAFTSKDGLVWGKATELDWSDGAAHADLLPESRQHVVKTVAPCRSSDDVREAIRNAYPVTCASNWGGRMQCPSVGNPPVLLNNHVGQWSHQMSCHAWWDHPTLGEIFWIQNQWGLGAHGVDPAGGPAGGFWIKKADMDWIVRNGEVYAFSQFDGFPSQDISWYI